MSSRYEDKVFCDKTDKLELFTKNNLFVNIGFVSFLNRCMKGFDRIIVDNERKTTLKDYITRLFPVRNLDTIMIKIKTKKISNEDYFHLESMLNTYMIENKIKKIREECKLSYLLSNQKNIFYNDHGHFMRMIIAMSYLKRFTVNEILQMAHIYFDYIHANISYLNNFNKKFNLKCDFNIFKDYINYHPNFEFFFYPYIVNQNNVNGNSNENLIDNLNNKNKMNIIDYRDIENQLKMQNNNMNIECFENPVVCETDLLDIASIEKELLNIIEEDFTGEFKSNDEYNPNINGNFIENPNILSTLRVDLVSSPFTEHQNEFTLINSVNVKIDLNETLPIRTGRKSPICGNNDIYSLEYLRNRLSRYATIYS